jgi:hypothetical protein
MTSPSHPSLAAQLLAQTRVEQVAKPHPSPLLSRIYGNHQANRVAQEINQLTDGD